MRTLLPFFAVIRVSGDDRHGFLHNQLSNNINELKTKQACYATYNTPKGRVIANFLVYNAGEALYLAVAADLAEKLLKRLSMFVLRAHVKLDILSEWGVSGSLKEDAVPILPCEPQLVLHCNDVGEIVLPHSGCLKIAPKTDLPNYCAEYELSWEKHEILSGYSWISAATSETCVAQMLNQHTIGGVHFRKGCYPGQEIIARAQYLGQVRRGLILARHNTVHTAGATVYNEHGEEVGIVINSAGCLNLLVIKHNAVQSELRDVSGSIFTVQHLFFTPASNRS